MPFPVAILIGTVFVLVMQSRLDVVLLRWAAIAVFLIIYVPFAYQIYKNGFSVGNTRIDK